MNSEFKLRYIKYIPRPLIVIIIMVIIVFLGLSIILPLADLTIYVPFIFIWIMSFAIYVAVVKEDLDYIDEKELKILLSFLDKREVIDYIRELINQQSISKLRHIGIELDAKFGTSITQKKGMCKGDIRDDWLYNKIEKLYEKIINEK